MTILKLKTLLIFLLCLLSGYTIAPNFIDHDLLPNRTINLGLDLRGGVSLLLQVDFNEYIKDSVEHFADDVSRILRDEKIAYKKMNVSPYEKKVTVNLAEDTAVENIEYLKKLGNNYAVDVESNDIVIAYKESYIKELKSKVINESISNIRSRIDQLGTREITIQEQGDSRILLQVPGADNPSEIKSILGRTAKLAFHLVDYTVEDLSEINRLTTKVYKDSNGTAYPILRKIIIGGESLSDASAGFNSSGIPAVFFKFNTFGTKKFAQVTKENINKMFAVVLDDMVLTAPVIREPILGGQGEITGDFTIESANELSVLLRAGALPAPIKVIEERTVGPTLGQDAINSGSYASMISLLLVIVFMFISYYLFGIFASVALLLNMVFIFALMSIMEITLTLPGIAGLILTIGMAVDANVLIFERIREEQKRSKLIFKAIESGFSQAMSTILDSNITTLIGSVILFIIGSGPIKGFAVTLSMGIICSMFSAIVITKLLITYWAIISKAKKLQI